MRRILQWVALTVVVGALAFWAAKGANWGWNKSGVKKVTVDETTGIEGITYEKRFVPGFEVLGGAFVSAGILTGISFLFRKKSNQPTKN